MKVSVNRFFLKREEERDGKKEGGRKKTPHRKDRNMYRQVALMHRWADQMINGMDRLPDMEVDTLTNGRMNT